MDRFGTTRNMGFRKLPLPRDRGYWVNVLTPAFGDLNVVGYSASNSSYVSETEQVIHHKGAPTILQEYYDKLNPKKLGLLNGHDEKADKFSTIDQADHRFWNPASDQSPPRALVGHGRKEGEGFSPRAQVGHQPWSHDRHGLKKDYEYSPQARVGHQPWGVTNDHGSTKDDGFSSKAPVQAGYNPKGSPRGTYQPMRRSPRARDHYDSPQHRDHGKYNNTSDESDDDDYGHVSDDDDIVSEGGVRYRKESESKLDNKHLIRQDYNQDKERTKLGHSYTKDNHNDAQLHKRSDYNTPPFTTSPRDDRTRYEQSNDIHHPPPMRTRVGPRQGMDLQKDQSPGDSPRFGAGHQPQYGSPRKEHQGRMETIDSGEAHRK